MTDLLTFPPKNIINDLIHNCKFMLRRVIVRNNENRVSSRCISYSDLIYFLLIRYLSILGRQNVDFLNAWAEIKNQPELLLTEEILCTTSFYKLPGLLQRINV